MSNPFERLGFLGPYLSQWKKEIALSLFALVIVSAASLVFPWLLKLMVDSFSNAYSTRIDLELLGAGLLILFIISSLLGYYQQITLNTLGLTLRNQLRTDLYKNLLNQSLSFHHKQQVGELSARATEDVGKVQHLFTSLLAPIAQSTLVVVGGLILTMFLSPFASLLLFLFLILPLPFVFHFSTRIRALSASSQSAHATANGYFEETLVAIREVKSLGGEKRETDRYSSFLQKALNLEVAAAQLIFRGSQSAYFLLSAMMLTMFYLAGVHALPGWTLGSMVAFYFYAYTIAMAVLSMGRIYLTFQNVAGALGRVEDLLLAPAEAVHGPGRRVHTLTGRIKVSGLVFSYDNRFPVLAHVSFEVQKGEWIVISGPSGSGKSTIANILIGFYRPVAGMVEYDDFRLDDLDLRSVRKQIGFVGQDPFLFHGTMKENLLSSSERDTSVIRDVLEVTCLTDLVQSLPDGLETVIGERGYTLSGGQKSRIAVARALISNPPILILDEANAMLEASLEERFWKNLAAYRGSRTTIILSHHFERIGRIDRFLVIEKQTLQARAIPGQT